MRNILVLALSFSMFSAPALCQQSASGPAASAMDPTELGDTVSGTQIAVQAWTTQTLTAQNSDNSVTGETVSSGDINLNEGAFSGFDGIGNFVLNTGHNNNLQGAISVVVVTTPP